ncbi:hypothetical protein [Geomesophilobacter sediminis]|uniref:Uncharacterized protein n=1 Tax=Geomesophilobacter sediminis TaxID=2798584 RepID=A0A8J7LWY2_9BACT|nr:hypothetical protein [Geomesophilobacter sediminis]MBJ6726400.1 hypothetical protein [Geomesophilobacter sediminis]
MREVAVPKMINLLSTMLRENPEQIPGQDGLAVAEWLDSLYYCPNDRTIYHAEGYSRKEIALILYLRREGIAPEDFMRRLQADRVAGAALTGHTP